MPSTIRRILVVAGLACRLAAGELGHEQRALLDQLAKHLPDPTGLSWASGRVSEYSCWGHARERTHSGWLLPAQGKRPAYLLTSHGCEYREPRLVRPGDFLASVRDHIADLGDAAKRRSEEGVVREGDTFRHVDVAAGRAPHQYEILVLAAWLRRLGQDGLAAQLLALRRDDQPSRITPLDAVREELAWGLFGHAVHAYALRADAEALHNLTALTARFPAAAAPDSQAQALIAELRRRQGSGRWSETPPRDAGPDAVLALPGDFAQWSADKRARHLVDLLDEVDVRQESQPGSVPLGSDARVAALIALGDAAVPALIECIEKDQRLCRSVHFHRDFSRHRQVLAAREAALTAAMSILRLRVFTAGSTSDSFTARGAAAARDVAVRLRDYWARYGGMAFTERMMHVLADPQAGAAAAREAAANLAGLGDDRIIETSGATTWTQPSGKRPPNPAIAQFSTPTAAEAMLAAWDRDGERAKPEVRAGWLRALALLGDARAAPELARRFAAATAIDERRQLARAALALGDGGPSDALAMAVASGALGAAGDAAAAEGEVLALIADLVASPREAAQRGLLAVGEPTHRFHGVVARALLAGATADGPDLVHPMSARVMLRLLDDARPTGATLAIENEQVVRRHGRALAMSGLPPVLRDPGARRASADEQVCDVAARWLVEHVAGAPAYHALLKDRQERLAALRAALAQWLPCLRRANDLEKDVLGGAHWAGVLIPVPAALAAPATAADVAAGRALAVLGGGEVVRLPAVPAQARAAGADGDWLLVVQGERRADGVVVYAGIARGGVVVLPADRLAGAPEALTGR